MAYLKPDSVPAQQEIRARKSCQIIAKKSKKSIAKDKKSYVVEPIGCTPNTPESPPPFNKPFGRG